MRALHSLSSVCVCMCVRDPVHTCLCTCMQMSGVDIRYFSQTPSTLRQGLSVNSERTEWPCLALDVGARELEALHQAISPAPGVCFVLFCFVFGKVQHLPLFFFVIYQFVL